MVAVHPAAVDMVEAIPATVLEMMPTITMEGGIAARVPERAIIAPIAIYERAVIAVVIAVIIIVARATGSDPDPSGTSAAGQNDESGEGKKQIPHGEAFQNQAP